MEQTKRDWSKFELRITIHASLDKLYAYWTQQHLIEQWFLERADFVKTNDEKRERNESIEKGDIYNWKWFGSDVLATGEVLMTNGRDELQFQFFGNQVTIRFYVFEDENMVELTQSEIELDEDSLHNNYVGCTRGWTFYLTNLKSILEGGIDLRNKNYKLGDVINT
jgi:uncharacterized protein YndB with AHSA1/START domain